MRKKNKNCYTKHDYMFLLNKHIPIKFSNLQLSSCKFENLKIEKEHWRPKAAHKSPLL